MTRATDPGRPVEHPVGMARMHVAIVSGSPEIRRAAAAAFDGAPDHWDVTVHREPVTADVTVCGPEDAIESAVVFDRDRATEVLGEVERAAPGRSTNVYVVTGIGGGVGATTLALHLAAAFGRSCAYLDLDLTWGAASRFGLDRSEIKTWHEIGTGSADRVKQTALPMAPGFRALFAPGAGSDLPDWRFVLDRSRAVFDPLVVDAPAGMLDEAAADASACVQVIAATATGVARAREHLRSFSGPRSALVLNRVGMGGSIAKAVASELLERPISLELPATPALRDAEDDHRMLVGPWTRYARKVAALARALEKSR